MVSAALVAVTENFAGDGTLLGALYSPLPLIVPKVEFPPLTPFTFHVTEVFVVLITVAVNCFVVFTRTLALAGDILMLTGGGFVIVTDALPTAGGVAALLLACTVTIAGIGAAAGAVYNPLTESMKPTVAFPPTAPFTSQVTVVIGLPVTVAVNCFFVFAGTLALDGLTLTVTPPCTACPESGFTISTVASTASKLDPRMVVNTCRSVLSQAGSGAPEMNHAEPLSARIIPYCFKAVSIT